MYSTMNCAGRDGQQGPPAARDHGYLFPTSELVQSVHANAYEVEEPVRSGFYVATLLPDAPRINVRICFRQPDSELPQRSN